MNWLVTTAFVALPTMMMENVMQDPNAILNQAGAAIVRDPEYNALDWDVIAIVYNFEDGRKNRYGYIFNDDGTWRASLPQDDDRTILNLMLELQAAMERQTGKKWLKALVHINRQEQNVNVTFDYDDPNKWVIKPADLETSVMALKP